MDFYVIFFSSDIDHFPMANGRLQCLAQHFHFNQKLNFCFRLYHAIAEIRALTGEPDYRSVNLTWVVENVPIDDDEPEQQTRIFSVFYCELQSWGPHRCKSKTLEDNEVDDDYDQEWERERQWI